MKRLILQVDIKPNDIKVGRTYHYIQDLYDLSHMQAKKYAQLCLADYIQINDTNFLPNKHIVYQKLKFTEYGDYDQILYVDSDSVILNDIPNIFDYNSYFAAVPDYNWDSNSNSTQQTRKKLCKIYNADMSYKPFCSGVMLFNKEFVHDFKQIYKNYIDIYETQHDQGVLNRCVVELNKGYTVLDSDWGAWYKKGKYIVHLGAHNKKNFNLHKFKEKYKL